MSDDVEWMRVRRHLCDHRHALGTFAGGLYPDVDRVAGTSLLTAPGWVPAAPVPLSEVLLEFDPSPPTPFGVPEPRYSDRLARLAPPAVFENRLTYRLRAADLAGPRPRMTVGLGRYFDGVDTGEARAHEVAARDLAHRERMGAPLVPPDGTTGACGPGRGGLRGRAGTGSPVDPARRPTNVAITAVTVRAGTEPRMLLHRRDPRRVAHAGGMLQVAPVGVFQPVSPATVRADLSVWRCLQRELAEELLGEPEATGPVDHDGWPTAVALDAARRAGRLRPSVLGLGVDPLTWATDLLCAVVVDPDVFDDVFAGLVTDNDEGTLTWHPFAGAVDGPLQAAGAAALALAWRHRERLLGA